MIYITNALSINLNWIGIKDVFVETFFVDRIYFHNDAGNDWNPFWMEKGYIYPIKIINICVSEQPRVSSSQRKVMHTWRRVYF